MAEPFNLTREDGAYVSDWPPLETQTRAEVIASYLLDPLRKSHPQGART